MELLIFIIVTVASFVGSIQPGPVNMQVLVTTLQYGKGAGQKMAAGGTIPELIYSAMALYATQGLAAITDISKFTPWIIITFFGVLGIGTLVTPRKKQTNPTAGEGKKPFAKGFFLGMLNPLLFTYWFGFAALLQGYGLELSGGSEKAAFIAGAAAGGFLLLYGVAETSNRFRNKGFLSESRNLTLVTGSIYLLIAFAEALRTWL